MENVGVIKNEDGEEVEERNEPLTEFNMLEYWNPFINLIPIDESNEEMEKITTTAEESAYNGIKWEKLSRQVIPLIHENFAPIEQKESPDTCIRVILQHAFDNTGPFIIPPEKEIPESKRVSRNSPHLKYQIQQSMGKIHREKVSVFQIKRKEDQQNFILLQTKSNVEGRALVANCAQLKTVSGDSELFLRHEETIDCNGKIFIILEHLNHAVSLSHQIAELHSDRSMTDGTEIEQIDNFSKYTLLKICMALELMHKNDLIHGDLKASNILCDSYLGQIRVITKATASSSAHLRDYSVLNTRGCPYWITPELVNEPADQGYTKEADVWAFGCLAYELATGRAPFTTTDATDETYSVLSEMRNSEHEPIPKALERANFADLIESCLAKDPSDRPTMKEILEHQFLLDA